MTSSVPPSSDAVAASSSTTTADHTQLVSISDDFNFASLPAQQDSNQNLLTPGAEDGFMKFLFKNNGVLFENDILQIGIKSEYKKSLGKFSQFGLQYAYTEKV